jgi:D-serine deaminase-like pyridoxal phosphate-dependent protein
MEANAKAMLDRASRLGCVLRPHVKTAKTLQAATIQTGGTKRRVVVSTVAEAEFLASGGFDDILYAVPITEDKFGAADELNQRLERFHVVVDHPRTVRALTSRAVTKPLSVVVMVDCGYHRDGVDPHESASEALVQALCASDSTVFGGLYTHGGHSYDAADAVAIARIAEAERDVTVAFAQRLRAVGVEVPAVGVGSTPTCSLPPSHLHGVDEMHPGNYIYYDMMQCLLGACTAEQVAVRVLTRVIGHYPAANMLLVDMGWTATSAQGKEHGSVKLGLE